MSTEENPTPQAAQGAPISPDPTAGPAWGASLPPDEEIETPTQVEVRPHWPASKVIGAVVIAAVIVGGGTAVAIAATSPSATATAGSQQPTAGGYGGGFGGYPSRGGAGGYAAGGALTNALHGDFVVQTNTGGYATDRLQTGKVGKVSSTSISLTSADGYAGTYAITTSTLINRGQTKITQVKAGDTVTVVATLSGNTATVTSLTDTTDASRKGGAGSGVGPTGPGTSGGMQPNDSPSGN